MNTPTIEEIEKANDWLEWLIPDDPQEQSPKIEENAPGQKKRPLIWAEFAARLERYCNVRQWEIIFRDEDDRSLLIYATHDDQTTDRVEALQEQLPFEEDALPF